MPPRAHRTTARACDAVAGRERNLVARCFTISKPVCAIATRSEKIASNALASIRLVCALAWLN
jgi:transposase